MTAIRRHGRLRLFEGAALALMGVVLAAAGVVDAVREVQIDRRAAVDKSAFTSYETATGHPGTYRRLSVRMGTRLDTVCARKRARAGAPRLCLQVREARRGEPAVVAGGYRLALHGRDVKRARFGCFGRAAGDRSCPTVRPARARPRVRRLS